MKHAVLVCLVGLALVGVLFMGLSGAATAAPLANPGTFSKTSPTNNATGVSITPTLTWETSSGATYYAYCYDTTNNSACDGTWVTTTLTSASLSGLSSNTKYYWQVYAHNDQGDRNANGGAWWAFTTELLPPDAFGKTSPANGATDLPANPTLSWETSTGATSYLYCYDTSNDSACDGGNWHSTTNTSASLSGLAGDTTYYWQVHASNSAGTTYADSGTWWSFKTRRPPEAFGKISPADTATGQPSNPTLTWETSAGTAWYEYCYDDTNNSACDSTWLTTTSSITHTNLSGLSANTTYYWQVQAANPGGDTPANSASWWSFTILQAPGAFSKSAPTNTASGVTLNPTLSWGASTGASYYAYCYDTTNNSACDSAWITTTLTSANLTGLAHSTTFYWQVQAINPGATTDASGGWWSFTTLAPPGAFTKNAPANGESDISLSPTLSWGSSSGVTSYEYCIDTTNDNSCGGDNWITTTLTSASLSGLTTSTDYYWQVRAKNEAGTTYADSGAWWVFTTVPPPPAAFNKSAPGNGAGSVSLNPTLSWGSSSGATAYAYCYDTIDNDTCDGSWVTTTLTSANLTGLTHSTPYYWQVRSANPGGMVYADSGGWWSFTTLAPPGAFNKSAPADAATDISLSPTLSWGSSSGAASYEYCIDTTNDDSCGGNNWISTTLTSANLSGLNTSTHYYWQVRANNEAGTTYASGGWWSFTTVPQPPAAFSKTAPSDGATDRPISLTISWHTSNRAASYQYCYDTSNDSACTSPAVWTDVGTATSANLSLTTGTTYYWQVKAVNAGGETEANSGTWWSFTTIPPSPGPFSKTAPADGAVNVSTNPSLSWGTSSGATAYAYCYDTNDNSACDSAWVTTTLTSASLSGLNTSTTYYWQVRGSNPGGVTYANSGSWYHFTTQPPPPEPFNKTDPADGAILTTGNVSLAWETSLNATSYEYCVDIVNDDVCTAPEDWVNVGSQTSANLSGLATNTTYYWQVRSRNLNENPTYANSGVWWHFSVLAPGPFNKLQPLDGAVMTPLTVTLSWSNSTAAQGYAYCLDTSPDSACTAPAHWIAVGSQTSITVTALSYQTTYSWQVRAFNPSGEAEANSGNWWSFTTQVAPDLYEPDNDPGHSSTISAGETQTHTIAPVGDIDWIRFSIPVESNVLLETYGQSGDTVMELYDDQLNLIGQDDDSGQGLFSLIHRICGSNPLPPGLYFVRVNEYGDNHEIPGYTLSLTTSPCAGDFSKTSPADGYAGISDSVQINWNTSNGADSYEYCYYSAGSSCQTWVNVLTHTNATLSGLQRQTTYYWQVRASNAGGYTYADQGIEWSFLTVDAYEPDDATPKPIAAGETQIHNIAPSGDIDRVTFDLTADSDVILLTDGPSGDTLIRLYQLVSGNWILIDQDDNSGPGDFSMIHRSCADQTDLPAGAYSLTVLGAGVIPLYNLSLTVSLCPPPGDFNKVSPADAATSQPLPPSLTWGSSLYATSYKICYDTIDNDACDSAWKVVSAPITSTKTLQVDVATTYYWQVTAVNTTGETQADSGAWWSFTTSDHIPDILLVDDDNNQPDVLPTYEAALDALGEQYLVWDTHTSDAEPSASDLTGHRAVIWFTGFSFGGYAGPGSAGENSLGEWLDQGNCLLLSSQDYLWDRGLTAFGADYLGIGAYSNDNGSYTNVTGANLFASLGPYNLFYPFHNYSDSLSPATGAQNAFIGNNEQIGAISKSSGFLTSFLAFPLEAISTTTGRNQTVKRFLDTCRGTDLFSKIEPANQSGTGGNVTLTWNQVESAASYQYCYDTTDDNDCTAPADWIDVGSETQTLLSGLPLGETYFWQVRATFASGDPVQANAGEWWSFTIGYKLYLPFTTSAPQDANAAPPAPANQSGGVARVAWMKPDPA
jgi:hypothetical protein